MKKLTLTLLTTMVVICCKVNAQTTYCIPSSSTPSLTYIETFETQGGSVNISNLSNEYTPGGYLDESDQFVQSFENGIFTFTAAPSTGGFFNIWVDWNNDFVFDELSENVVSMNQDAQGVPITGSITIPSGTPNGDYRMRVNIDIAGNPSGSTPYHPCKEGFELEFEDYTINVIDVPTCIPPTNLSATIMTETSVYLDWTNTSNSDIEYGATGFSPTGTPSVSRIATSPYDLTNLTASTFYDFYVRSNCDDQETSDWVGPITFYTGPCVPHSRYNHNMYIRDFTTTGGNTNISSQTTFQDGGFFDGTSQVVQSFPGNTFDFNVTTNSVLRGALSIWVDWSQDLVFDNAERLYGENQNNNVFFDEFSGSITIPDGTANGDYRMRAMVALWGHAFPTNPCELGHYTETEDYTITVDSSLTRVTGINSIENDLKIVIFPNPSNNGLFTIKNARNEILNELNMVEVININGQVVFSKNNIENTTNRQVKIDLSDQVRGVYILIAKSNFSISSYKLIVQ